PPLWTRMMLPATGRRGAAPTIQRRPDGDRAVMMPAALRISMAPRAGAGAGGTVGRRSCTIISNAVARNAAPAAAPAAATNRRRRGHLGGQGRGTAGAASRRRRSRRPGRGDRIGASAGRAPPAHPGPPPPPARGRRTWRGRSAAAGARGRATSLRGPRGSSTSPRRAVTAMTRSSRSPRPPAGSLHVDRLDVDELADAERAELAPVAGLFEAAERQPRVGAHEVVDEAAPRLEPAGDRLAAAGVAGEDGGAEAEDRVVGHPDRLLLAVHGDERRHRPEQLFLVSRHPRADAGE